MNDTYIKSLAQQYGTPLYLYDKAVMIERYHQLKDSIFPDAKLFYSMKANPALGVCRVFRELGAGVEAASMGEIYAALAVGFKPQQIIFTSPGKTRQEIEFALKHRTALINIESLDEARLINEAAGAMGITADIGIRINPAVCYSNAKIKMSGVSSQFGNEEEDIDEKYKAELNTLQNLNLCGIQVYMGTQMLLAEDIIKNTEYAMGMALRLSKECGFPLKYLNVGGGFGVKYFKNETPLDLAQLKNGMDELKEKFGTELKNTEVIFESGRFLMADAGVFVTQALYVKESKGQKFVVCDGGSNFHSSAAFLGRFVRNNFPMYTIPEGSETAEYTVCGPLCTSLDVIGQKVMINADIAPGDLVVIEKSGAYGYTYSPCKFLSHEQPIELMSDGDAAYVIRERESVEELIKCQL
ncbi:MAG: diaminopimelate decarboxylase [Clostridiales bacterium]|nr:diaminopimelate decarboxylase [Clostridiales bacterium]